MDRIFAIFFYNDHSFLKTNKRKLLTGENRINFKRCKRKNKVEGRVQFYKNRNALFLFMWSGINDQMLFFIPHWRHSLMNLPSITEDLNKVFPQLSQRPSFTSGYSLKSYILLRSKFLSSIFITYELFLP